MTDQTCRYCDGELEARLVTRLQRYNDQWYIIENVPALVCRQCGEQYFTPAAHDLVIDVITGKTAPTRTETVTVFDVKASGAA